MLTLDEAQLVISNALGDCHKHKKPAEFKIEDIAEVIDGRIMCSCNLGDNKTCNSYCDTESFGLLRLLDGQVAVWWEWSDTSGHG